MLNYPLPVLSALALTLTLTSACNPEAIDFPAAKDAGPGGSGAMSNNPTGATGSTGSTVGGGVMDAGLSTGTAVYADGGSAGGDAAATDSGVGSVLPGGDGGIMDAGTGVDGSVACGINDRRFGCGTRLSVDWIHFASGLDIDTKYGRAWSPVITASSFQALRAACGALVVSQVTNFDAPEMDDVRTLGAGCAATVPGGSCAVQSGVVLPSQSGSCSCPGGVGPNQGKFCRPEVPDCQTLWTLTECGGTNAECPAASSWFYDVRTGSVVLGTAGQPITQEAKARCVAPIVYRAP